MNVIDIQKLTKSFGSTRALRGINLTVRQGEVHGFIGPNGAGKSTTIRILLGILRKTSGQITLLDGDPWKDAVRLHRRLAYVPGDVTLWPDLSGGEIIDLLGRLHGGLDVSRKKQLLERFQLDPAKKSGTYSKGNRQKVALVAAFSCEAELYLLDEPTSGLDPLMEAVTFTAMADKGMQSVLAEFDKDPLVSAVLGPVMSFDLSGAIVWRGTSQMALVLGIGSLLTVIRHTRRDEETGRSELIRAYAVGPYANLTAALLLAVILNLSSGVLIALSNIALGGAAAGSFLLGGTMSVVGCFFAGIGALGVQLRENSGTARGFGVAAGDQTLCRQSWLEPDIFFCFCGHSCRYCICAFCPQGSGGRCPFGPPGAFGSGSRSFQPFGISLEAA